jgi:hypothetical protein
MINSEVEDFPEPLLDEVLDFVNFLKIKMISSKMDTAWASEASLKKDWLLPEEDKAWQNFVKGDVVVVPFPFADLTQAKRRPEILKERLRLPGLSVELTEAGLEVLDLESSASRVRSFIQRVDLMKMDY